MFLDMMTEFTKFFSVIKFFLVYDWKKQFHSIAKQTGVKTHLLLC